MSTNEPSRFSRDFKLDALRRMEAGENVSVLARELGVSRKSIYQWRDRGIWLVSFMEYDLGYIDLEQKTLQTLDNPFGPRLSPMS